MSDELLMHISSNSNPTDPSLPTKLAKLEARMAGKGSLSAPVQSARQSLPSVSFGASEELLVTSSSSDSDNDSGGEFLIQANTQKRQRILEDEDIAVIRQSEGADGLAKMTELTDNKPGLDDSNRKKQGRGRGRSTSGRGRGLKIIDQARSLAILPSNGHLENSLHKENQPKEHFENIERAALQEEISLLRNKVSSLEEKLCKSCQEAADYQKLCQQLEKELKDFKEQDQQLKTKRLKILSDLLISVSKAERQEARMKVRQESLRLGNVGIIRTGTIISETWEDGQTLKDINAHLCEPLDCGVY